MVNFLCYEYLDLEVLASGEMSTWLVVFAFLMAFFILLSHSQSQEELSDCSNPFHTSLRQLGQGHWRLCPPLSLTQTTCMHLDKCLNPPAPLPTTLHLTELIS